MAGRLGATPPRGYDDPRGLPELRAALAEHLARTRGLRCDPDEIVVTGGTTDGLRHLLGVLRPARWRWRIPATAPPWRPSVAAGRDGRRPPALDPITDLTGRVAAYVTPAHQHPLGRVMPAEERLGLLEAARRADAVVVEDDYDSEFRYDVAPVPALATLDRSRVAYLGTASKSVAPSLRLGWMVPPPQLLDAINARREATHEAAPWPVQRAFLSLLRDGYVDRVVRTARRVYAERAPQGGRRAGAARRAGRPARRHVLDLADAGAGPPGAPTGSRARPASTSRCWPTTAARARLTGLIVGFGGVTDDQLDRALEVLRRELDGIALGLGVAGGVGRGPLPLDLAAQEVRRAPQQREDRAEHEHDRDQQPEADRGHLDRPAEQVGPLAAQQAGDEQAGDHQAEADRTARSTVATSEIEIITGVVSPSMIASSDSTAAHMPRRGDRGVSLIAALPAAAAPRRR